MHQARNHGIPGIDIEIKNFDFRKVIEDELNLVTSLRENKYKKMLASMPLVTVIEETARFVSKDEVEVNEGTRPGDAELGKEEE